MKGRHSLCDRSGVPWISTMIFACSQNQGADKTSRAFVAKKRVWFRVFRAAKMVYHRLMKDRHYEWFGWYGAIAILASYVLVSWNMISAQSFVFHALNLTGGVGVAAISYRKHTLQPVVINTARAIIAFFAILEAVIHAPWFLALISV